MADDTRDFYKLIRSLEEDNREEMHLYDSFDLELSQDFVIETGIVGFTEDGIIVESDEKTLEFLEINDIITEDEVINEAEYHGRKVSLGKPFLTPDGPKKRSVYVKKPNGKVVKVNFGDKKMRIKKSNPARRKSFRARHRCENPGPRWKARYWACKTW